MIYYYVSKHKCKLKKKKENWLLIIILDRGLKCIIEVQQLKIICEIAILSWHLINTPCKCLFLFIKVFTNTQGSKYSNSYCKPTLVILIDCHVTSNYRSTLPCDKSNNYWWYWLIVTWLLIIGLLYHVTKVIIIGDIDWLSRDF